MFLPYQISPLLLVLIVILPAHSFTDLVSPREVNYTYLLSLGLSPAPWPLPTNSSPSLSFVITSTCCGYGPFTAEAVANASAAFGLFDVACMPSAPAWPTLAEWGYEFFNNAQHIFPVCGNLSEAAYILPPLTRADALHRLELYWRCRAEDARGGAPSSVPLISEIGHYLFSGQSASFGNTFAVLPGSEIGENINSINLHLAATRGAARPYSAAWLIDFSSWFAGFLLDYSTQKFWGPSSSPTGGHSLSLHRRSMYAAFMGGAGAYVAEAGAVNYLLSTGPSQPLLQLSPLGAIGAEFFAFTHTPTPEAARGVPYIPVGLVMEATAGLGLGFFYHGLSWDVFPPSEAELRLATHLEALWPGSFTVESQIGTPTSESLYMVGGREGVDLVLRTNLTAQGLADSYRVVFFPAAGLIDEELAGVIEGYVLAGGCAILAADDAAPAAASGWLPVGFLGLELGAGPPTPLSILSFTDVQTGWVGTCSGSSGSDGGGSSNAPPPTPFCASQNEDGSGSYYIKTGGDATQSKGWAPSRGDKCCSTDGGDCKWFGSSADCAAALATETCRACACGAGGVGDVGCPSWNPTSPPSTPYYNATLMGNGEVLLMLQPNGGGDSMLGAVETVWGDAGGRVVTFLAPGAQAGAALGVYAHLLSRALNDTLPFFLASNFTGDALGTGGVQSLFNTLPGDRWVVTLINNNGVSKQPATPPVVDASSGREVRMSLVGGTVGGGSVVQRVTARDGANGAPYSVPWVGGSCTVEVPAGGLRVVEFQFGV